MIESVEKRKRLIDMVQYWCNHTKVSQHLRESDIPSLVGQIIDEFYHITLSCGHHVMEFDEGVHIAFNDFVTDRSDMEHGGGMSEVSGIYCHDCAERYKKELGAWEPALDKGEEKQG